MSFEEIDSTQRDLRYAVVEPVRYRSPADRHSDAVKLEDNSRAWFVTIWGRPYEADPAVELLFVLDLPKGACLEDRLAQISEPNWMFNALLALADASPLSESLIMDNTALRRALVAVGSAFKTPASAYLNKEHRSMPMINNCIKQSLLPLLNSPALRSSTSSLDETSTLLEAWCTEHNSKAP